MSTELRDILTKVAAGEIAPDEASRLLGGPPEEPLGAASPADGGPLARRIVIAAEACRLVLVSDTSVAEVAIDGPHGVTRDGDVLRVGVGRVPVGAYQFEQRPANSRWFPSWAGSGSTVRMRVNPFASIDLTSSAAGIEIRGMRAPLGFDVGTGSVKVTDHVGTVRGRTSTGSVSVEALVQGGESRLDCELGSLDLRLLPGSGVRLRTRSELGSVSVAGKDIPSGSAASMPEFVIGDASGVFDVWVRLGSAKVLLP